LIIGGHACGFTVGAIAMMATLAAILASIFAFPATMSCAMLVLR